MYEHEQGHSRQYVVATADTDTRWAGLLLAQTLDHHFEDLRATKARLPPSFDFDARAFAVLDRLVRSFVSRTPIAKIKIYNAEGRTIYSTSPSQIGEPKASVLALQDALRGKTSSGHERRDSFEAVEGI